jgi:hypothetical protein
MYSDRNNVVCADGKDKKAGEEAYFMNEINLGNISIPINAATKTFAILAKRGAGKSYTAAVLAEEFFKNNIPFVVFDPIDIWYGLRFAANGKDKGLPVVVFGIEHSDIILTRDMGQKIARAVVKDNISCVISTFGLPKVAQRHLITEFSEEILRINNTPRHIFIEEAHEFVPQRIMVSTGKCFNAVSNLVVMGRNRGLGVTLINQRAATINKDVLTQLDTLLAFRNVSPQDRKALREWVEYHAAEGDFNKFMDSLPSLPTGEGWIWSPEFLNIFKRIKIRKRETFHPDREKLGQNFEMPQLTQTDIQEFINHFNKQQEEVKKEPIGKKIYEEAVIKPDLTFIRNEYESRIMQKDMEICALKAQIQGAIKALGIIESQNVFVAYNDNSVPIEAAAMLERLGGMPKNVYERLLKHSSGLTKRQIALMCTYSVTSGSFSNALSKLTTMGLVKKEGEVYRALLK